MFSGSQAANVTSSDVQALEGFHDVAMMVFRLMLVDDYPFDVRLYGRCWSFYHSRH